jgi:hypothetical protein
MKWGAHAEEMNPDNQG